jgi:hypothetical protein
LGCLAVVGVVAVGAGAWWLNGGSIPTPWRSGDRDSTSVAEGSSSLKWESLTEASTGGTDAVLSLGRRNGPAYVTLSPGDLAGFLATGIARSLPRSAADPQVAIEGNRIHIRALVRMRDLAGEGALGSALGITLGRALDEQDTLHIAGTMDVRRPGLAQYHVDKLAVRSIDVPQRLIPQLVRSMRTRAGLKDSLDSDALPIPLPRSIGDIRISNGRITLYRATQ